MANVHRIGDYVNDNEANRPGQQRQVGMGNIFGGGQINDEDTRNNPLVRAYAQQPSDPRRETFWTMLKIYFCPAFTWKSFIVIIILIDIIMFIVSLAMTDGLDENSFLSSETRTDHDSSWRSETKSTWASYDEYSDRNIQGKRERSPRE